ncbi:MAG: hypothetical protein QOH84_2336 [Kribbellaceae bacterium]|jgi:hypothetical protein|nr:hypothetical protein [Kribbellaceae bacterium]
MRNDSPATAGLETTDFEKVVESIEETFVADFEGLAEHCWGSCK